MDLKKLAFWNFEKKKTKDPWGDTTNVPGGRVSIPDIKQSLHLLKNGVEFVTPEFTYEMIPVIRKLLKVNSSVSLATNTIVELANTGFDYKFRSDIPKPLEKKMRDHLHVAFRRWGYGTSGIHGVINKMIYQIYIGGAISIEWVPSKTLTQIDYPAFLNPENIRTAFNPKTNRYSFYQVPPRNKIGSNLAFKDYIPLNDITYQYTAFFNDEEIPIGTPPFMSALDDIQHQLKMLKNIGFVTDQLGVMGFLEFLMRKPDKKEGEGDEKYRSRIESLLTTSKESIKGGLKDGIVVGYKNDHEFDFHSSTKDTSGVSDIFNINHRMVANGLFMSPQFLGGLSEGSEALLTVVFTKMLSQLNNIHLSIAETLEKGIELELMLAGYSNPEVDITFRESTITDKLKNEQAREYLLRNLRVLYLQGIIDQSQFAKEAGYEEPAEKEPIGDPDTEITKGKEKQDREQDKDKSDRKTRDKNKPQPKRNDSKTKER